MVSEEQVHPCVCGFVCNTKATMKRHRRKCEPWQNRPNPKQMQARRRWKTRRAGLVQDGVEFCSECQRRSDHHVQDCVNSQDNVVRRMALAKHGINPAEFEVLLRLLAKRYDEN